MTDENDNQSDNKQNNSPNRSAEDILSELGIAEADYEKSDQINTKARKVDATFSTASWFWGTIIVLAVVTLSLAMIGTYRSQKNIDQEQAKEEPPTTEIALIKDLPIEIEEELLPSELRKKFNEATEVAYKYTEKKVDEFLSKAYEPVVQSIPEYVDFHYSIWGSYKELGDAAFGDPEREVETRLLLGLNDRVESSINEIDKIYETKFSEVLNADFSSLSSSMPNLGSLTKIIYKDAALQTGAAMAVTGGALISKGLAKGIVQKISASIVAKAAAKLGSKWVASLTGAGTAGLACAWAGPGASVCAVAGGAIVWFSADVVINKLDKIYTRKEFEADLLQQINESKKELSDNIKEKLNEKVKKQKVDLKSKIQDFTLKQLSEFALDNVCERANDLKKSYHKISNNLEERTEEKISLILKDAEDATEFLGMYDFSNEITNNLIALDHSILAKPLNLSFYLPAGFRTKDTISGTISLNQLEFSFKSENPNDYRVNLDVVNASSTTVKFKRFSSVWVAIELEQDNWGSNDYFKGEDRINRKMLLESIKDDKISIPIKLKVKGQDQVRAAPATLDLLWSMAALPDLKLFPKNCLN
jgi:hypothetical protein